MSLISKPPRGIITPEEFIILSAELHYILSDEGNDEALAALVIGTANFPKMDLLVRAIHCLRLGYAESKRKVGPLAVLHPLRTAAILARSMSKPELLDVMGALFHDKEEDLTASKLGTKRSSEFEDSYQSLILEIDPNHRWFLGERVAIFCRKDEESYTEYIARLIECSYRMPDVLHTKLADRLDNTFDQHLSRPGVTRYNFYRTVFDILFLENYPGINVDEYHVLPPDSRLVLLLSQLFKDAIFLTLLRRSGRDRQDSTVGTLFDAVAVSGIREAQWITFELFASEITDPKRQRALLLKTMDYCFQGGAQAIHEPSDLSELDGSFAYYYGGPDDVTRKRHLAELCLDREKLVQVVLTFIALFSSFLNDPNCYLRGFDDSPPKAGQ